MKVKLEVDRYNVLEESGKEAKRIEFSFIFVEDESCYRFTFPNIQKESLEFWKELYNAYINVEDYEISIREAEVEITMRITDEGNARFSIFTHKDYRAILRSCFIVKSGNKSLEEAFKQASEFLF